VIPCPPGERETLLDAECGTDSALREHVESLLAAAEEEDDAFSEEAIVASRRTLEAAVDGADGDASHDAEILADGSPRRIGPYRILGRIGMGGMGVVFEAEQQSPRRKVALKVLNPLFVTDEVRRRFRLEGELLGRLQHPHIAQIFESGTYDTARGPQPFFAMEFVTGTDLRTWVARNGLDTRGILRLLATIAEAVHHAHERGIVHRDLKPENILIDGDGAPRILDFGVARVTESSAVLSTLVTDQGELLGTLAYMAPEQLGGDPLAISSATDVYALGVIAFELLGRRLPHEVSGLPLSVAIRTVSEDDAPRLGSLSPTHRGDVEVIVAKALEKDPTRRYPSAAALAADLGRHLDHLPIAARPPGRIYRLRKLVRRRRAAVLGIGGTVLALAGGLVTALLFWADTKRGRDEIRENLYRAEMLQAGDAMESFAGIARVREIVESWVPGPDVPDLRGWEWTFLDSVAHAEERRIELPVPAMSLAWTDDGRRLVAGAHFAAYVWDSREPDKDLLFLDHGAHSLGPVIPLGDSGRLLTGGTDLSGGLPPRIRIWNLADGSLDSFFGSEEGAETAGMEMGHADLSPDGALFVFHDTKGSAQVWEVRSRTLLRKLSGVDGPGTAFDPVGRRLSTGGDRGLTIQIWDTASWERLAVLLHDDFVRWVSWAPDGGRLASAVGLEVRIWDVKEGVVLSTLSGHRDLVWVVEFSPDGRRLATSSRDRTIRIWNAGTGEVERVLRGHTGGVVGLAWHPDSRHLASVSDGEGTLRVWDTSSVSPVRDWTIESRGGTAESTLRASVDWTPDGVALRTRHDWTTRLWEAESGELLQSMQGWVRPSPRGGVQAVGRVGGVAIESAESAEPLHHLEVQQETCTDLSWDPEGRRAVVTFTRNHRKSLRIWRPATASVGATFAEGSAGLLHAWHPGGEEIVWADLTVLKVVDAETLSVEYEQNVSGIHALVYSHDGALLAIAEGGADPPIRLFETREWTEVLVLLGNTFDVSSLAFSPDDRRLASGGRDGTVRIWDPLRGELVLTLRHEPAVVDLAWSPDGRQLAALDSDLELRIWDARRSREQREGRDSR